MKFCSFVYDQLQTPLFGRVCCTYYIQFRLIATNCSVRDRVKGSECRMIRRTDLVTYVLEVRGKTQKP